MQNFFGQLYIDLGEYLKQAVTELRWIDQDFGQLEQFEYRPEVSFPCCLVDFPQANYTALAGLAQAGEIMVSLRVGFAPFSQSHQSAPLNVREKALAYYNLEQRIFEAVQGWYNDFTTPFIRVNAMTENREDSLRVRVIVFSTSYEDLSALPMHRKVQARLEIEPQVTTEGGATSW